MVALKDVCFGESEVEKLVWRAGRFTLTVRLPWNDVAVPISLPTSAWLTWSHLAGAAGLPILLGSWQVPARRESRPRRGDRSFPAGLGMRRGDGCREAPCGTGAQAARRATLCSQTLRLQGRSAL